MGQVPIYDFGPDPLAVAAGKFGEGFSSKLLQNIEQKKQEDALSGLLGGISDQTSQQDMLKQILAERNIPFQQRVGLYDAISNVRQQTRQQQAADQLAEQMGLPKGLTAEQIQKQSETMQKSRESLLKRQQETQESQILAKLSRGEDLTPEEQSLLSPTSQRALLNIGQPKFETEEEKLEAQRVSEYASDISRMYNAAQTEDLRLKQQERLIEKGNLTSPVVVKFLDYVGLPISVLGNPDSEEYAKVEADFVRDVSSIFRGQIRVYEIEAFMKTIPSLLNSDEGKKRIIEQRRLMNEASKIKYKAYKDIIKENDGKKPRNLDILVEERTAPQFADLLDRSKQTIREALDKHTADVKMYDADGREYNIPPYRIEASLKKGLLFR